ncbi:MAG: hypothetical protein WBB08_12375 [Halobacteriota archaeon]
MNKLLPVAILAVVVLFCSASTAAAWVGLYVTPDRQVTCPQTSSYWAPSTPPMSPLLDDKAVTYTVTVETDDPPVSVVIIPGETPIGWFSWLSQTLPWPDTAGIWPLYLSVPLMLGEDAKGVYTFTVSAVDFGGASASATVELVVQDHDYVSETLVQIEPENTAKVTVDERFRSMPIATSVDKHIEFNGTVEHFEKNEYLLFDALTCPNFQQETMTFGFSGGRMKGDEKFKSCAPLGGTGVSIHEQYDVDWMEQRVESLGHYITSEQRYKTELSTYNTFNGTFMLDARQLVPVSRYVKERQTFDGNLTVGRHLVFRLPQQYRDSGNLVYQGTTFP